MLTSYVACLFEPQIALCVASLASSLDGANVEAILVTPAPPVYVEGPWTFGVPTEENRMMSGRARPAAAELLERGGELEGLEQAGAAAADGSGSIVALEGVAEIGKTSLLAHAGRIAWGAPTALGASRWFWF